MTLRRLAAAALLLSGLAACAGPPPPSASPVAAAGVQAGAYLRDELFFGMRKRDGTLVSEAEWQAFVDSVVSPRFPPGLTVLAAYGQYQPRGRPLVREPGKVLILVHPGGPDAERHIHDIAALYCRRFDQESVMRVTDRVSAEFMDGEARWEPQPPR